jgi:rod shape determining protein RodA
VNLRLPVDSFSVFKTTTRERWDPWTPIAMAGLGAFGIAFIYSAQLPVQGRGWMVQLLWLLIGAGVYVTVSLIDYQFWLGVAHWIYALCIVPLVLVLVPGIGTEVYGSQRWIRIGMFSFQPSDTANMAVLLITASLLVRSEIGTVRQSLGVLGKLALAVGAPVLLILRQPDFKSAIVLPPMVFSMLYVSRLSARFFAGALAAFLLLIGLVAWDTWRYMDFMEANGYSFQADKGLYEKHSWIPLHDYQRNRILAFVDPRTRSIRSASAGTSASRSSRSAAAASTGKGWTRGRRPSLGYLPRSVAHNDFIFSVIAEEKGFPGKHYGSRPVWSDAIQRHPHRGSLAGPLRHAARPRRHGALHDACVREHRHDHRARAHYGHTASLYKLRWLLCAQLLLAARTGPERLSLPEGLRMTMPPSRDMDRFAGISCAATIRPRAPYTTQDEGPAP